MFRYFIAALIVGSFLQQTISISEPFSCDGRPAGYYADIASDCQQYHVCNGGKRQYTYSCPNTTRFQQRMMICDHEYLVDCGRSEQDFSANLLIGQKDVPFVRSDELYPKRQQFIQPSPFHSPSPQPFSSFGTTQQSGSFNKTNPRPTSSSTNYFYQKSAGSVSQFSSVNGNIVPRPFTSPPVENSPSKPTVPTGVPFSFPFRLTTPPSTLRSPSLVPTAYPTRIATKKFSEISVTTDRPSKRTLPFSQQTFFRTNPTTPSPSTTILAPTSTTKNYPVFLFRTQNKSLATSVIPRTSPSLFSSPPPSSGLNFFPTPFPSPSQKQLFSKTLVLPTPKIPSSSQEQLFSKTPISSDSNVLNDQFQDDNSLEARSLRHPAALKLEWTLPDTRAMLYIPDLAEDTVLPNIKKYSVTIPQPRMNFKENSEAEGPCPLNCNPAFFKTGSCLPCVVIK